MRQTVTLVQSRTMNRYGIHYRYWVLRWYAPSGRRHSKCLGPVEQISRREAERLRREKQSELDANPGRRNVSSAPRLGDFVRQYLQVRRCEVRPGTLQLHAMTGRYLLAFFGETRRLDAISRIDARAFRAVLAAGELDGVSRRSGVLAEPTVNLHIRNARKVFAIAMEDDLILANPFDRLAGQSVTPKAWHEVTDDEFGKLMDVASRPWRVLLSLSRYAGLRRGEALNLRWNEVDLERSRLKVIAHDDWRPKDRDARIVPIVPELRAALLAIQGEHPVPEDLVVPDGRGPFTNASRQFNLLCRRAGIQRYEKPFHTLRKTCLTRWARQFPAHVVAAWAGHSSIETTREYYLQVSEAEYERAAQGM